MSCNIVYVGQNDCANHPEQLTVTIQGDPEYADAYAWAECEAGSTTHYAARYLGAGVYEAVVDLGALYSPRESYTVWGSIGTDECSTGYDESCYSRRQVSTPGD
jgi:hypothetical protein